jgi:hypothetical protein
MYKGSRWDQEASLRRHRICHRSLGWRINRDLHHRILYLKHPGWIVDKWGNQVTVTGPVSEVFPDPEDLEMIDLEGRETVETNGRHVER